MSEEKFIKKIKIQQDEEYALNASQINDTNFEDIFIESITYSNLKAKRDAGELIAGRQYRITDYECTTIQVDTRSVGYQFDIIVTADDVNILNENARAIQHEEENNGDNNPDEITSSDLSAWELKYCLDNKYWSLRGNIIYTDDMLWFDRKPVMDTSGKYAWYCEDFESDYDTSNHYFFTDNEVPSQGDVAYVLNNDNEFESYSSILDTKDGYTEEGKGVIYYMKDEYCNECPYDFKNVSTYINNINDIDL